MIYSLKTIHHRQTNCDYLLLITGLADNQLSYQGYQVTKNGRPLGYRLWLNPKTENQITQDIADELITLA
jgi:hypothetical protein